MSDVIETFKLDGFTAQVFHDQDASSPEDWSNVGTLAFKHDRNAFGDLPNDPYDQGVFTDDCPVCAGDGRHSGIGPVTHYHDSIGYSVAQVTCPKCEGYGYVTDGALLAKRLHDAVVALPIRSWDDRMGTELRVADSWENANGWIYATAEAVRECLGLVEGVDPAEPYTALELEQIREAMTLELEAWCQYFHGDVYGYVVNDPTGEQVEACWGFYGLDDVVAEAKSVLAACVQYAAEQAKLIDGMMRL